MKTNTLYSKLMAIICITCTTFSFVLFGVGYSSTMRWIDVQLGRSEVRQSFDNNWFKTVGLGQIDAYALDSVVVVQDIPRQIEAALAAAVSGLLNNIVGKIRELFNQLIGKIQEMSSLFASIGKEAGNILGAIHFTIWPQIEKTLSSCSIVTSLLPSTINSSIQSSVCDAVSRIRFAKVAQETADLTTSSATIPSSDEIQKAEEQLATAVTSACKADSDLAELPFAEVLGVYSPGCASDIQQSIEQAVSQDTQKVKESFQTIQNRAPADCKQPFMDFSNTDFSGSSFGGISPSAETTLTGESISSEFLNQVYSFAQTTEIKVLTPDECESLKKSADAALAGTQVTPPSNSGASGLEGVIQTFMDQITGLINDLVNSVIKIATDALESVFQSFPRVFSEGFSGLIGNFSGAISEKLSSILSGLRLSTLTYDSLREYARFDKYDNNS